MSRIHRVEGSYPYYALSDRALYVTRGAKAEEDETGITLEEWLAVLGRLDELTLDERYEIKNPHTEEVETWIERGRARCLSSDGEPGWFSYMPRHLSNIVAKRLPSIRLMSRFEKVLKAVGGNPSLSVWREHVRGNRYLRLEERWTRDGKPVYLPGRAVTLAKSGGTILFLPSAVFVYFSPAPYEGEAPDSVFLAVSRRIARLLKARVVAQEFPGS